MRVILVAVVLAGCSHGSAGGATPSDGVAPGGTNHPTSSDTGTAPVDTGPFELNGTAPPAALPAPEFASVVNQDVTLVSRDALLGHPTVLWFYPAATTGG